MKRCSYCRRDNADDAAHCRECGTELKPPEEPLRPQPNGPEYLFEPLSPADQQKDWITLVTCRTLVAADLVTTRLRAAGIETFLPDERLMQLVGWNFNTYGNVRVQITPKDYDAAKELLSSVDEGK